LSPNTGWGLDKVLVSDTISSDTLNGMVDPFNKTSAINRQKKVLFTFFKVIGHYKLMIKEEKFLALFQEEEEEDLDEGELDEDEDLEEPEEESDEETEETEEDEDAW
jgi:hypothetical protein